ncbi:hypothetical protein GCM10020255_107320 [Rhodococcus baikonurensis]
MANGGAMDALSGDLLAEVIGSIGGVAVTPAFSPGDPHTRTTSSPEELDALCGLYRDAAADFVLERTGGSLTARRTDHIDPSINAESAESVSLSLIEVHPEYSRPNYRNQRVGSGSLSPTPGVHNCYTSEAARIRE